MVRFIVFKVIYCLIVIINLLLGGKIYWFFIVIYCLVCVFLVGVFVFFFVYVDMDIVYDVKKFFYFCNFFVVFVSVIVIGVCLC